MTKRLSLLAALCAVSTLIAAPTQAQLGACGDGIVYDDGSFESLTEPLVEPGKEGGLVMRFDPSPGTTTLDRVCVCLARDGSSDPSIDFDLVVLDDDGVVFGSPGTEWWRGSFSAAAVPVAPHFYTYDLTGLGVTLPPGGFFLGLDHWDPDSEGVFLCEDLNSSQRAYGYDGESWGQLVGFGTLGIRAEVSGGGGSGGPCVADATTLCLAGGRFQVRVDWRTVQGTTGQGMAEGLTSDTGYFWFFSSDNVEMVVKVLDACGPPFDRFWVFAGGLTNVEVTMTVVDTEAHETRVYTNPLGTAFRPLQDTDAFATCP